MKERPILFSAPMVRAILEGRKTQTRRAFSKRTNFLFECAAKIGEVSPFLDLDKLGRHDLSYILDFCPYGKAGDRLNVKESAWMWCEHRPNGTTPTGRDKWHYVPLESAPVIYAADHPAKPLTNIASPDTGNQWGWRLKIGRFLPRWASRITLEITNIRVERLKQISNTDIRAEGACKRTSVTHLLDFQALWESINGAGSWDKDPWVWVIEFKRVQEAQ